MSTTRFCTPASRPATLRLSNHETDVPLEDDTKINICGVFHATTQGSSVEPKSFWVTDISLWPLITDWLSREGHYNEFTYTPYSSRSAWEAVNTDYPIIQEINAATFTWTTETYIAQFAALGEGGFAVGSVDSTCFVVHPPPTTMMHSKHLFFSTKKAAGLKMSAAVQSGITSEFGS